ncbi:sugar kinase [Henriciella sp.]|uniref:sugar kinase n=1 Tax=Henriciella sp. TaxID=1968823 RepID=UPI002619ED32|nr:sugar kinase [Henriciella sp.]
MTKTVATLGELMLRLKPAGKLRLRQASGFELCHGGAEANVATSLACFGLNSRFVTALPDHEIGTQALMALRATGIDTGHVLRRDGRMGLYFMEEGADYRSGCVIYDRDNTAFSNLVSADIDWDGVFNGVDWFHISGITPAVCETSRQLAEAAVKEAKARGVHVSIDLNHRERLWNYGVSASDVMPPLVSMADTLIAGRGDCPACLEIEGEGESGSEDWARSLSERVLEAYPNLSRFALTIRTSSSADVHDWQAFLRTGTEAVFSRRYTMSHVVDRVGTGDAFCAGLIYALLDGQSAQDAINFGAAANSLKHSIAGDANQVTAEEVLNLAQTSAFGRLRR